MTLDNTSARMKQARHAVALSEEVTAEPATTTRVYKWLPRDDTRGDAERLAVFLNDAARTELHTLADSSGLALRGGAAPPARRKP